MNSEGDLRVMHDVRRVRARELADQRFTTDAQMISEVALSLRNLSFTLSSLVVDSQPVDVDSFAGAMFSLNKQASELSDRLERLSETCRGCISGNMPRPVPVQPTCEPRAVQAAAARRSHMG